MGVFIFLTEKAFDLFSLPKDDENVIETCKCLQFGNKQIHCYIVKLFIPDKHILIYTWQT